MNSSPDGDILARIEQEIARTDPDLVAMYNEFPTDGRSRRIRPVPVWRHPRFVLASIVTVLVVVAAVVAALFAARAGTCAVGHTGSAGCPHGSASCVRLPARHGVARCQGGPTRPG